MRSRCRARTTIASRDLTEASRFQILEPLISTARRSRRVDDRRIMNGIFYVLRTGCQWNQLPACFGDDSTVHRHFQPWCQRGVLARLWAVLVETCDELGGVDWQWQATDAAMGKARMGGDLVGRNPTDRGKKG